MRALGMHLISVVALAVVCFWSVLHGSAVAQTSCNTALVTLEPCYPYIVPGNTTNPTNACCSPLAQVFQDNATCLCQLVPIAKQVGIAVNQTRALEVASLCNQDVTNVTSCLSSIAPSSSVSTTAPLSGANDKNHGSVLSTPLLLLGSTFVAWALYLAMSLT